MQGDIFKTEYISIILYMHRLVKQRLLLQNKKYADYKRSVENSKG